MHTLFEIFSKFEYYITQQAFGHFDCRVPVPRRLSYPSELIKMSFERAPSSQDADIITNPRQLIL